jgi:hypothetical protein
MRITNISLQNFRSHVSTSLEFERLTVIRGVNAGGKSSIEQAVELTLAGHAEGTTTDGKGSVGLIRLGEKKAMVGVAIADGATERLIQMALNGTARDVLVTNPQDPQWTGGEKMKEWLKASRETISCLCNNRFFVDLDEDKQKNILAAIILPKTYEWPEWVKPAAAEFRLAIDWDATPFQIMEQGYALAFKTRTDVNRDAKQHQVAAGDTSEAENLSAYEERLAERKQQLEKAIADAAGGKAAAQEHATIKAHAEKRRDEARARIDRESAIVAQADGKLLSKAKLAEAEKIAKNGKKAGELDEEVRQINTNLDIKGKAKAKIAKLVKTPKCPTCMADITEEHLVALMAPLDEEMTKLKERQDAALVERKELGDPAAAIKQIEIHKTAETEMDRAKQRIKDDQAVLQDAEAKLDEITNAGNFDTTAADKEISDLREMVATGQTFVQKAKDHRDLAARIQATTSRRAELQAQQMKIDKLVKYFGEEVKEEMLTASIGGFTENMNEVLANWGYVCRISIEPYIFAIAFSGPEGTSFEIPLKHLSKSQRYRFAVAFQVALAVTSGFGFVIVDEADIFDSEGRSGLYGALLNEVLDQAIVIGTDERMEIPPAPDAVFYRFEDVADKGTIPTTKVTRLVAPQEAA